MTSVRSQFLAALIYLFVCAHALDNPLFGRLLKVVAGPHCNHDEELQDREQQLVVLAPLQVSVPRCCHAINLGSLYTKLLNGQQFTAKRLL
jgi:hypothetical protein